MITVAIGIPVVGLAYAGGSGRLGGWAREAPAASASSARAESRPSASIVENCNVYAAEARDKMRIAKNGAIGAVVGAGAGAAGGAIVDGGDGLGKGAGIGALVGAAAGAMYGLNEENKKSDAARAAYADCIARGGE